MESHGLPSSRVPPQETLVLAVFPGALLREAWTPSDTSSYLSCSLQDSLHRGEEEAWQLLFT